MPEHDAVALRGQLEEFIGRPMGSGTLGRPRPRERADDPALGVDAMDDCCNPVYLDDAAQATRPATAAWWPRPR